MSANTSPAILCFSKSGHTRRAADTLAQRTVAEVIPIETDRYKVPLLWILRAIWDVGRSHLPPLTGGNVVTANRPWIVVACPIWADQPASPARSVINALASTATPVGLLTTSGGAGEPLKCVATCETVLGRRLAASLNIQNKIEDTPETDKRLDAFAHAMMTSASQGVA
ncbi:hypothetical protein [uncultured Tateyamaria sp.]|uniref:hypothetical protein n=1 Tax=uncultured Tateyamaria sp. TaxID=455651 RepID=UPI002610F028|nr:hypothetical protein [uncultured Tateyamaria sp.]